MDFALWSYGVYESWSFLLKYNAKFSFRQVEKKFNVETILTSIHSRRGAAGEPSERRLCGKFWAIAPLACLLSEAFDSECRRGVVSYLWADAIPPVLRATDIKNCLTDIKQNWSMPREMRVTLQ